MIRRRRRCVWLVVLAVLLAVGAAAREREAPSAFAERRARLRAQVAGPVVLFGYTGAENSSPSYIFQQEEYFFYLTGHAEEGAAVVLIPQSLGAQKYEGPNEILFLPSRDARRERWNGSRLAAADRGIAEEVGFAAVKPFTELRGELEQLSKIFTNFYTLEPARNARGYPHAANWHAWLKEVLPKSTFGDAGSLIAAMRQVKSPGEIALLTRAIELSIDAHLEAMRMMRPGIYEYEIAARMEYVHKRGGAEAEAYAPIVGSGFNSTVLHYNKASRKIEDGDLVVMDVGASYAGYSADITRTLPAGGKFTPRQREIYEIVLGAQNAVLAALKPGAVLRGPGSNSMDTVAKNYINSHGKDLQGKPLGEYFIHGVGHHIGLNVHDVGDPLRLLEPGMVITIEPGIYIPEEKIGVRIEDNVLITETGYKLLSARLPRTVEEIERVMAEARKKL